MNRPFFILRAICLILITFVFSCEKKPQEPETFAQSPLDFEKGVVEGRSDPCPGGTFGERPIFKYYDGKCRMILRVADYYGDEVTCPWPINCPVQIALRATPDDEANQIVLNVQLSSCYWEVVELPECCSNWYVFARYSEESLGCTISLQFGEYGFNTSAYQVLAPSEDWTFIDLSGYKINPWCGDPRYICKSWCTWMVEGTFCRIDETNTGAYCTLDFLDGAGNYVDCSYYGATDGQIAFAQSGNPIGPPIPVGMYTFSSEVYPIAIKTTNAKYRLRMSTGNCVSGDNGFMCARLYSPSGGTTDPAGCGMSGNGSVTFSKRAIPWGGCTLVVDIEDPYEQEPCVADACGPK